MNALSDRLDSAIAVFAPGWALARARARRAFSYEAAVASRLRGSARAPLSGPENYTRANQRLQLIKEVRDLEENFGLWQGIIDKLATYTFGRVRYQQRTSDPKVNQQYEDYLNRWFDSCDIRGQLNFQLIIEQAFKAQIRDGDFGLLLRRTGTGDLALQGIESDRIGGGNGATSTADPFTYQGVKTDPDTGAPLAFEVFDRTLSGQYVNPRMFPAVNLRLLLDPRRADQCRGVTPFAPIINEARDLKEVLVACLAGTKLENYHAAIGYTETGRPLGNPSDFVAGTETTAAGDTITEQEIKPGMIQWAPSNAKYDFVKSDRPSGTFQSYIDLLVRLQAIALNLPYSFIYQMLGTGPAVRADLQMAARVIAAHQSRTEVLGMDPIVQLVLVDAFARGALPFHPEFQRRKWLYSASVSIDGGRESAANISERNAGVRSTASIFAEAGEDAGEQEIIIENEVRRKIETATKIAAETGVSVDFVLTMLGTNTPNGFLFKTPEQAPAGGDPGAPPDGSGNGAEPPDDAEEPSDLAKAQATRQALRRFHAHTAKALAAVRR